MTSNPFALRPVFKYLFRKPVAETKSGKAIFWPREAGLLYLAAEVDRILSIGHGKDTAVQK